MAKGRTKIYNNVVEHRLLWDAERVEDITRITLPTLEHPTDTYSGEGLTADLDIPNESKVNAMEMSVAHNNGVNCNHLKQPGIHSIEVRIARQMLNTTNRQLGYESDKYRMEVEHKSTEEGTIERGNPLGSTEKFTVWSYQKVVDGNIVDHVDATSGILIKDGVDCTTDISAVLD